MKRILMGLIALIFLGACNQNKIAFVEIEKVLQEYEGSVQAEMEMKSQSDALARELDALALPLQQKFQEYQAKEATLSSSEKQKIENELMQEQQALQQRQQIAQQQIQMQGQEKIAKINEEIDEFLVTYAEANGYQFILGSSEQTKSVMYGQESLNITDELIEALNGQYQAATPSNEVVKDSLVPAVN